MHCVVEGNVQQKLTTGRHDRKAVFYPANTSKRTLHLHATSHRLLLLSTTSDLGTSALSNAMESGLLDIPIRTVRADVVLVDVELETI